MADRSAAAATIESRDDGTPSSNHGDACVSAALAAPLARILACASFDDLASHVIAPLCDAIGAARGVFVQFLGLPLDGDTVGRHACTHDDTRHATEAYADGLYTVDPMVRPALDWLRARSGLHGHSIGLLSDIASWRDEGQYRRFLERYDIGDVLAVAVPTTTVFGPEVMCLGFHRSRRAERFTVREIACVRGLMPAIQAVLRNLAHGEALQFSGHVLNELAECGEGTSLLVLDQDLRIRHANHRALGGFGAGTKAGALRADVFGTLRKRLLDAPPLVGARMRTVLAVQPAGSRAAQLLDVEVRAFRSVDGRVYYLVIAPDGRDRTDAGSHAARYGLTRREQGVVDVVCLGKSSAAVARELGITRRTVENHLRSVYGKVGVNSRTELAARLLRGDDRATSEAKRARGRVPPRRLAAAQPGTPLAG